MSEVDEVVRMFVPRSVDNARSQAVTSIDDDPEQAKRSIDLSKATGVPAEVIHGDVDTFDRDYQTSLTASIVSSDPHLVNYANSSPMATKISTGDWGKLAEFSRTMSRFANPIATMVTDPQGTLERARKFWSGVQEGWGEGPLGQWMLQKPEDVAWAQAHPGAWVTWSALAAPLEVALQRLPGAVIGGVAAELAPLQAAVTGEEEEKAKEGVKSAIDFLMLHAMGHPIPHGTGPLEITKFNADLRETVEKARPYIENGREPPPFIHPVIDDIKKRQVKFDAKNLDDAVREAGAAATRERSQDIMAALPRSHTEASFWIDTEVVQKLYGEKVPTPDDGILGWVPNLDTQLKNAEFVREIAVPIADYVVRIEPDVHKALREDIRFRENGMTIRESKEIKPKYDIDVFHGSPHEFEAFDISKIGTGEGAQSYGHGLYFAEAQGVAESYKSSGPNAYTVGGRPYDENIPIHFAAKTADIYGRKEAINMIRNASYLNDPQLGDLYKATLRILESDQVLPEVKFTEGSLYKVRILADKEQFLDWDKPLSEQPNIDMERINQVSGLGQPAIPSIVGSELYNVLTNLGGRKAASKALREAGIPGIKYLDQQSRGRTRERIQEDIRMTKLDIGQLKTPEGAEAFEARTGTDVVKGMSQLEDKLKALQDELRTGVIKQTHNFVVFDDSLVQVIERNGEALRAAREQVGFDRPTMELPEGEWKQIGKQTRVFEPTEFTPEQTTVIEAVNKWFETVAPKLSEAIPTTAIEGPHGRARGIFQQFSERKSVIAWSLNSPDIFGTARHEVIHYLRNEGFIKESEWATLSKAAKDGKWVEKYGIDRKYKDLDPETQIEEAIAEAYRHWERDPEEASLTIAQAIFKRLKEIKEGIYNAIKTALGKEPNAEDIFGMIESGEVGAREGAKPLHPEAFREAKEEQPELPHTRRIEDTQKFKGTAQGMTEAMQRQYEKKIEQQRKEDEEWLKERALKFEKRKQTKEWKEREAEVAKEVTSDLQELPHLALLNYFINGVLLGQKGKKPMLDASVLSGYEKRSLPRNSYGVGGVHPDEIAPFFNYGSGQEMVRALIEANLAKGDKTFHWYFEKLVWAEVDKRMEQRYGDLDKNIMDAAQEHIFGSPQMDRLWEEMIAAAVRAGAEPTVRKEQVKAGVADIFSEQNADRVRKSSFERQVANATRKLEEAGLKQDFQEMYRQSQRRFIQSLLVKEAMQFDKEKAAFEAEVTRTAKGQYEKMPREYNDFAQFLLTQAYGDQIINRDMAELRQSMARTGFSTLESWANHQRDVLGWDMDISGDILAGNVKPIDQMTVGEWRDFRDALKVINHVGRESQKIEVGGRKLDFEDFKQGVIANITSRPPRDIKPTILNKVKSALWKFDASWTKVEEIVKDLDLREALGPLFNAVIRPLADSQHSEFTYQEELTKSLRALRGTKEWRATLKEEIPNDFLYDPHPSAGGGLFTITRENMLWIMLNFGSKSGIEKFVEGYASKDPVKKVQLEQRLRMMFRDHANPADWDFVQKIWDLFDPWQKASDEMYYNLNGKPPKWIAAEPIGPNRGGYFPVIFDKDRSDIATIEGRKGLSSQGLFGGNYHRASVANHYTKTRTGIDMPVDFQSPIEALTFRMQQQIHDISFRQNVMQVARILADKEIRAAIRQHYGKEYDAQLEPWLKDIASKYNMDDKSMEGMHRLIKHFRTSLVTHALGFNMKSFLSPEFGTMNLAAMARYARNFKEYNEIAEKHSNVIPHTYRIIDRDFNDALERGIQGGKWDHFQADAMRWGFYPAVAHGQLWRTATFVDFFKEGKRQGMGDGEAGAYADSIVRQRHGSSGVVDLPAIMRGTEERKLMTLFYGYFSAMYNWQRSIPESMRRGQWMDAGKAFWGTAALGAIIGAALYNKRSENEDALTTAWKALVLEEIGYVPVARDVMNYLVEGHKSGSPWSSFATAVGDGIEDIKKYSKGKKVDRPIQHVGNIIGMGVGLPLGTAARLTQHAYDIYGKQDFKKTPRNAVEWLYLITRGKARLEKEKK